MKNQALAEVLDYGVISEVDESYEEGEKLGEFLGRLSLLINCDHMTHCPTCSYSYLAMSDNAMVTCVRCGESL